MSEHAFVESTPTDTETRSRSKFLKLSLNEDGSIDWDSTSQKHTQAFIDAVKADPNGILQNIKEEAGSSTRDDEPEGIADATVLAVTNALMVVEALGITYFGPKIASPLKNLHPIVAIKACTVSLDEMTPVMPACKRIIKRYVPLEYLGAEYQDLAIVGEHLIKLSAAKFKACIDLAVELERLKREAEIIPPNGRGSKVEIH
jgi:hypothetical protein